MFSSICRCENDYQIGYCFVILSMQLKHGLVLFAVFDIILSAFLILVLIDEPYESDPFVMFFIIDDI